MDLTGARLSWSPELNPGYRWPTPVGSAGVVGLFAPAGEYDPGELARGADQLRSWGFEVKIPKNLGHRPHRYLAGTVAHRLEIISQLMEDETVDGLMAVRGGFGCQHLLPQLAEQWSQWPAKPIYGFSDLTALHLARLKACGVVGYHAPMITSLGRAEPTGADRRSRENLKKTLLGGGYSGQWSFSAKNVLRSGTARGPLLGGNLTLLCALLAGPWLPNFSGAIIMLEEVDEPLYRLDRLLTTLKQSPVWSQARGLVFGGFNGCGSPAEVNRLLKEAAAEFPGPVLGQAPFSHAGRNLVFPVGALGLIEG